MGPIRNRKRVLPEGGIPDLLRAAEKYVQAKEKFETEIYRAQKAGASLRGISEALSWMGIKISHDSVARIRKKIEGLERG